MVIIHLFFDVFYAEQCRSTVYGDRFQWLLCFKPQRVGPSGRQRWLTSLPTDDAGHHFDNGLRW